MLGFRSKVGSAYRRLLNAVFAGLQGYTATTKAPSKTNDSSYKASIEELKVNGLLPVLAVCNPRSHRVFTYSHT